MTREQGGADAVVVLPKWVAVLVVVAFLTWMVVCIAFLVALVMGKYAP